MREQKSETQLNWVLFPNWNDVMRFLMNYVEWSE